MAESQAAHLSPETARWQIPRIAHFRQVAADRIRAIVDAHVEERDLGVLGEPRVNLLVLNIALYKQLGQPPEPPPAPSSSSSAGAAPAPVGGAQPAKP